MAEENQEEEGKIPVEIVPNIVKLGEFLDPHLSDAAKTDIAESPKPWRAHKAAAFIIAASLILWGGIFALIHYAYRFGIAWAALMLS